MSNSGRCLSTILTSTNKRHTKSTRITSLPLSKSSNDFPQKIPHSMHAVRRVQLLSPTASISQVVTLLLAIIVVSCANLAASSQATTTITTTTATKTTQLQLQQKQQQQKQHTVRIQQCREGCLEKFATKELFCQQNPECLTCWDECAKPPPPKINKSIRETWSLYTVSMLQQDSLVLVDVAWAPLSTPNQCLVTWEVSGGGLMGNLLTESFNVQLSLWPDTKYRVQVTCKNKKTGAMSRSLPLTIDTAEAITLPEHTEQHKQTAVPTTPLLPIKTLAPTSTSLNEADFGNSNSIADVDAVAAAAANSIEDNAPILPYQTDYQLQQQQDHSAETLNQHTNFIFNWHTRNSDISAIEPLHKPDMNILTIAALSDMQKPLLFGVAAGTLLLALVLLVYVCIMRQQARTLPNDKTALFAEDPHAVIVSMPPPTSAEAAKVTYNSNVEEEQEEEACKNPAICSRNALKV